VRVLIIEDDDRLRAQLTELLQKSGYAVDMAADGDDGLFQALEHPLDIAVIDLGLPGVPGDEIIRQVRTAGLDYPILVLTARDAWQSKVEGLEAGADDYLVKPFHPQELIARLGALLRRTGGWTQAVMQCGPLTLDTARQRVTMNDEEIELTAYEYRVLEYLVLHVGEVVSKRALIEQLYDEESDRYSNTIEVFIRRLRKKLDHDNNLDPIETLRGRGYRLTLERGTH
jgi:two-component system response regulator PhoP